MKKSPFLYILLLIWLLPSCVLRSQNNKVVQNRPYIDQRPFHYGFLAGVHMQDIEFENNGHKDAEGNEWYADAGSYEPGFSVGILGEVLINKYLSFRVVPSMHFGTKQLTFRNHKDGAKDHLTIKSTYVSLPLDLKISGQRINNYRPYAMVGVDPMLDLTIKKNKNIRLRPFDCYLEAGIGCDFYLPFFKFIPEIKFCYGLSNIIEKDRDDLTDDSRLIFTQSVNGAKSKMIVITLYFE